MSSEMVKARAREARDRREQILEDAQWLYEGGVHPEWWPKRVGSPSLGALLMMMRRAHREGDPRAEDLMRVLERVEEKL